MNKSKSLIIVIFIGYISSLGVFTFMSETRSFSDRENRFLTQVPTFTLSRFMNGEFTRDFEQYVKDQFIWKDSWIVLKASAEQIQLKKENQGVYFGKDGYLFEPFKKPGKQLQKNIHTLNQFISKMDGFTSYMVLAPTSVEIYHNNLPAFAPSYSQRETLKDIKKEIPESIRYIDIYDTLFNKKKENIYFRTDHHWTMRGAYYAYQSIAKEMGITPVNMADFTHPIVSENFYGTFFSKANPRKIKPDTIEIFEPTFPASYEVHYVDTNKTSNRLFEFDHLSQKDQYRVFLDGNHPLVTIKSSVKNNRKLAVIKDSYAHAILPFLANHFAEIHVIDPRYYHSSIPDYFRKNDIHEILFLYNIVQFSTDTNLIWLLGT